jgi:hypothetical protein
VENNESYDAKVSRFVVYGPSAFDDINDFDQMLVTFIQRALTASDRSEISQYTEGARGLLLHVHKRRSLVERETRRVMYEPLSLKLTQGDMKQIEDMLELSAEKSINRES